MRGILKQCPVCSGKMVVREVECVECETKVISQFNAEVGKLDVEQDIFDFIKVFIFAEGSIKQSEKILNCSYPKVKNLLKKAKVALGVEEEEPVDDDTILDRLANGELNVEETLKYFKRNSGRKGDA